MNITCSALALCTLLSLQVNVSQPSPGVEKSVEQPDEDLAFESSPFVRKYIFGRRKDYAVFGIDLNTNGAWRTNVPYDEGRSSIWYIEEQRPAADVIVYGIVLKNTQIIEKGLLAINWGFRRQEADGSFNCPNNFHSTSFFVEAAAHACIRLLRSPYKDRYATALDTLIPRIVRSAEWLIDTVNSSTGNRYNKPYTHRQYLMAAALGETGVLSGDVELLHAASRYVSRGMSLQEENGVNPEKGGFDCSYQAVGMEFAHRYIDLVSSSPEEIGQLMTMYQKGADWLMSRVDSDGSVRIEGNTRTGYGAEKNRDGSIKPVSFFSIARALAWFSFHEGRPEYETKAIAVMKSKRVVIN